MSERLPPNRKKLMTTVYLTPEQDRKLKALSGNTKVPASEYVRQGVDLALEKYRDAIPQEHRDASPLKVIKDVVTLSKP